MSCLLRSQNVFTSIPFILINFFLIIVNIVNQTVLDQLVTLANAKQLKPWIERLFSQEKVNCTEQRAAMHWALRLPEGHAQFPELTKQVHLQLERMYALVEKSMLDNIVVPLVKLFRM